MEYFYYLSKYPIKLCNDYIKHSNVYDWFMYTWEEKEGYYLIKFDEFRRSILTLGNVPKPIFKVVFKDLGDQTGISVQYMNPGLFKNFSWLHEKDIDKFWEIKLDAKRIKNDREKHTIDSIFSKLIKKRTWKSTDTIAAKR